MGKEDLGGDHRSKTQETQQESVRLTTQRRAPTNQPTNENRAAARLRLTRGCSPTQTRRTKSEREKHLRVASNTWVQEKSRFPCVQQYLGCTALQQESTNPRRETKIQGKRSRRRRIAFPYVEYVVCCCPNNAFLALIGLGSRFGGFNIKSANLSRFKKPSRFFSWLELKMTARSWAIH